MRQILLLITTCLLTFACTPKSALPKTDPPNSIIADHAAKQMKRSRLELVASNCAPSKTGTRTFALHYNTNKKLELREARKLIVLSVEEFLNMANADESLRPCLDEYPLTVEHLHFNLGFVSIDGEFYDPPCVSYAYLAGGKITYCYYDNLFGTFTDYEDIEESYNTALEIVKRG